jgi:hypothetical protein
VVAVESKPRSSGKDKGLPAPTADYIVALLDELKGLYAAQDEQIDRMREVRELRRRVELPDEYRFVDIEVKDPTVADEIQRVAAMTSVNPPTLHIKAGPGKVGDTVQNNLTLRQNWTEQMLWAAGTRVPGYDTYSQIVDAVVGDGGAWCKFLFVKDLWDVRYSLRRHQFEDDPDADGEADETSRLPEAERYLAGDFRSDADLLRERQGRRDKRFSEAVEEAKKNAGPPFVWTSVDARTIYPVWSAGTLTEVVEVQERPAISTLRQYNLGYHLGDQGEIVPEELMPGSYLEASDITKLAGKTVKVIEHWNKTWCSYVVSGGGMDGVTLKQWKHGYGQVPYFYAPGLTMNHWRNRKVGWSVAEAKRWLVEYRSYLWTLHAQVAARDALGLLFREVPTTLDPLMGTDNKPVQSRRYQLGTETVGRPGEKLSSVQFPPAAASLKEQLGIVSEAIDKMETPRVSGHIGGGMEGAGFAYSQVFSEGRIKHEPNAKSIGRMLTQLTRFAWSLVRNKVKEDVWVYCQSGASGYLKAGPKDLTDMVGVSWSVNTEKPSAQLLEERAVHERLQAGTLDLAHAIERLGDSPAEIGLGKVVDQIMATPQYQQWFATLVFEDAGMGELMKQANEIVQSGMLEGGFGPVQSSDPMALAAGQGALPGNPGMPGDQAALAGAPSGFGMMPQAGIGPGPGNVPGNSPGAVLPEQGGAAGLIQPLGIGR